MEKLFNGEHPITPLGIMLIKYSKKFIDGAPVPRLASEFYPFNHNQILDTVNFLAQYQFIQYVDNKVHTLPFSINYISEFDSYLGSLATRNFNLALLYFLNEFNEKINPESFPEILKKLSPETTFDINANLSSYLLTNSAIKPFIDIAEGNFIKINKDGKIKLQDEIDRLQKIKDESDTDKKLQALQHKYYEMELENRSLKTQIFNLQNSTLNMGDNNGNQTVGDNNEISIEKNVETKTDEKPLYKKLLNEAAISTIKEVAKYIIPLTIGYVVGVNKPHTEKTESKQQTPSQSTPKTLKGADTLK